MPYLNCPRCHLAVLNRVMRPVAGDCPRCLARDGIRSPLFASPLAYRELTNVSDAVPPVRADK